MEHPIKDVRHVNQCLQCKHLWLDGEILGIDRYQLARGYDVYSGVGGMANPPNYPGNKATCPLCDGVCGPHCVRVERGQETLEEHLARFNRVVERFMPIIDGYNDKTEPFKE